MHSYHPLLSLTLCNYVYLRVALNHKDSKDYHKWKVSQKLYMSVLAVVGDTSSTESIVN
jgi:hypothetical protein